MLSFINFICHKKCSKCLLSASTHARTRAHHWITATLMISWSNLDHSSTNRIGSRHHGFACGRRASAACPRLHSPLAWDHGCLEAMQRWYEIWSITTQHLDCLTGPPRWTVNADVRVNFMKRTLMEMVNFWRPFIKCQYFNDGSSDFH